MKLLGTIKAKAIATLLIFTFAFIFVYAASAPRDGMMAVAQLIGLGLFLISGLLFFLGVRKHVIRPLSILTDAFDKLSRDKDLSVTLKSSHLSNHEFSRLGTSFNGLAATLQRTISELENVSQSVSVDMETISGSSEELTADVSQEAASIGEASAILEQLTSQVTMNRDDAQNTGTSLVSFNKEVQEKRNLMSDVSGTMQEIHESGKRIDAIVAVINDISFQTNLLALNAAVEAARAGDAGRGFAVVAAEVRNLAQKTAESSKTIKEIVSQNVDSTSRGLKLVNQSTEFFNSIVAFMNDMTQQMEYITEGSQDQADCVEQINSVMSQLAQLIDQHVTRMEVLTTASENLKSNSTTLTQVMETYHADKGKAESFESIAPSAESEKNLPKKGDGQMAVGGKGAAGTNGTNGTDGRHQLKGDSPTEDDFFTSDEEEFEEF